MQHIDIARTRTYVYNPPASYIAVWHTTNPDRLAAPDDMIQMPPWVNRSQVDEDAFKFLAPALDVPR